MGEVCCYPCRRFQAADSAGIKHALDKLTHPGRGIVQILVASFHDGKAFRAFLLFQPVNITPCR